MEGLHQLEIVILLLAVVLALTTIAQKIFIPYPILLVIGGLILGVIPGLPTVTLSPDLVFLVFLPPILWARPPRLPTTRGSGPPPSPSRKAA